MTVATLVTGHTSVSRGLAYIVAQTAGCALAAGMHVSEIKLGPYMMMLGSGGQHASSLPAVLSSCQEQFQAFNTGSLQEYEVR